MSGFGKVSGGLGRVVAVGLLASVLSMVACNGDRRTADRRGEDARLRTDAELLVGLPGEIQDVLLDRDPLRRAEKLAGLLRSLPPEALDDVLAAYDTVFLDVGEFEFEMLVEWWGTFDPAAAMAWTQEDWRADDLRIEMAALRAWARTDPQQALLVAETEPSLYNRRKRVASALRGWGESGEPGVLDFVESLSGSYQQLLLGVFARRLIARDGVDATLEWAAGLEGPMDLTRQNLLRRIAGAAAAEEPEKAAAWTKQFLGDDDDRTRLPEYVALRWVQRDPVATFAWLSTLDPGTDQRVAVREAYRQWLRLDKPAAWAWLEAQPDEPWSDEARGLYALSRMQADPKDGEIAVAEAAKIDREELRWATAVRTWKLWVRVEPDEAAKWYASIADEVPDFYRDHMTLVPAQKVRPMRTSAAGGDAEAEALDGSPANAEDEPELDDAPLSEADAS